MSKWAIVFNDSDGEFWVYPWEHQLDDELRVSEKIKLYKEKAGIELTIGVWEKLTDTLRRYAPEEYFGESMIHQSHENDGFHSAPWPHS
jgi:hypothetical protein